MHVSYAPIFQWFKDRPKWLQDATRRILQDGELPKEAIDELVILCKREAGIRVDEKPDLTPLPIPDSSFSDTLPSISLTIDSIGQVQGINALSPKKPLLFGPESLTIVYGANGSGKSGYTRLLKH